MVPGLDSGTMFCVIRHLKGIKEQLGMRRQTKRAAIALAMCGMLGTMPAVSVYAGSINENEAGVLEQLQGEFEYDGYIYTIDPGYLSILETEFMSDSTDLTANQAKKAINAVTGDIEGAVKEGYLIKVRKIKEEATEEPEATKEPSKEEEDTPKETSATEVTPEPTAVVEETAVPNDGDLTEFLPTIEPNIYSPAMQEQMKQEQVEEIEQKMTQKYKKPGSIFNNSFSQPLVSHNIQNTEEGQQTTGDTQEQADNKDNGSSNKSEYSNSNENSQDRKSETGNTVTGKKDTGMEEMTFLIVAFGVIILIAASIFAFLRRKGKPVLQEDCYMDFCPNILPGIADGVTNMSEAVEALKAAQKQGVSTVVATPRVTIQTKITPEEVQKSCEKLQAEAKKANLSIEILPGEMLSYHIDMVKQIEAGKLMTLAGSRYILVEFPKEEYYPRIYQGLRNLTQEGYIPILAHMEQYACLYEDRTQDRVQELIDMGAYLQMDVTSLRKEKYRTMVRKNKVHLVTGGVYTGKKVFGIQSGVNHLGRRLSKVCGERVFLKNPKAIREDKYM